MIANLKFEISFFFSNAWSNIRSADSTSAGLCAVLVFVMVGLPIAGTLFYDVLWP